MGLQKMKNTICEMKHTLYGINRIFTITEVNLNDLKKY